MDTAVVPHAAIEEIDRRFPKVLRQYQTTLSIVGDDPGGSLTFTGQGRITIQNVLLANTYEGVTRLRHVQFATVIPRRSPANDYQAYLNKLLHIATGHRLVAARHLTAGKAEIIFKASQFANMYLMSGLHETSIGFFIDQHREILLSAFKASQLISEPHLPWLVPSNDPKEDKPINPDLFVQRSDGYWDICELKLPLLDSKDVTVGQRSRRTFISPIEKGMAQLVHYRDFLSIPEHSAFASKKYGVEFNNPRLTLIFGNHENVNPDKFREARRRFPDIEVIDYDSVLQLYLINNNALT